jgi:hypothetical protein
MTQFWNEVTGQLEPTYYDVAGRCWTDPPRYKRDRDRRKHKKTHVLRDGKALCGKKYPHWFPWPGEQPTCDKCLELIQVDQS